LRTYGETETTSHNLHFVPAQYRERLCEFSFISPLGAGWQEASEAVIKELKGWREQHSKATLREIEAAVDEQLGRLRRQMVEDTALASQAAEWEATSREGPVCPQCGTRLERRGKAKRTLTTAYDQTIELERWYGVCPGCQTGLFPPG
jgi:NADH pyrophosphatase NudC (nudix superfamily)